MAAPPSTLDDCLRGQLLLSKLRHSRYWIDPMITESTKRLSPKLQSQWGQCSLILEPSDSCYDAQSSRNHNFSILLSQPKELSSRLKEDPVNSKNFLNKTESNVRQDELFFYRYFKQRQDKQKRTHDENKEKQSDEVGQGSTKINPYMLYRCYQRH